MHLHHFSRSSFVHFLIPFYILCLRKRTRYFLLLLYPCCAFYAFVFVRSDAGTFVFRVNMRGPNYLSTFIVIINVSFRLLDANSSCRYTERDCFPLPACQMFQKSQDKAGRTQLLSRTETLRIITHVSTAMGLG